MTATTAPPVQPRAESRPHISASQLRSYSDCSLRWYLGRRYRPEFISAALLWGSGVHAGIQHYYQKRLQGEETTLDEMLTAFDRVWEEETLPVRHGKKGETRDSIRQLATVMFEVFVKEAEPSQVIAIEERFEINLAEGLPPLVGYIDLIEVRDGHVCLVDFKTAARKPNPDDVDAEQLILYGLSAHRDGLVKSMGLPLKLEYRFITKTKSPEMILVPVLPDKCDARRVTEKAKIIVKGMRQDICFPNKGWQCAGCGYRKLCAKWPDLPVSDK